MKIVLASSSPHRRRVLAEAGIEVRIEPPEFDERSLDDRFGNLADGELAVLIATAKARSVADRVRPGELVLAGDQLAVVGEGAQRRALHKAPDLVAAVRQLIALSGTTHRMVNGLVVWDRFADRWVQAVDEHVVTMRSFSATEAADYVRRFEPLDSVGCYRIEDDADLVARVTGSGDDGLQGMPIDLVRSLLTSAQVAGSNPSTSRSNATGS